MIPLLAAGLALAFPLLLLCAAVKDAVSFTIPNWISLALLAVFPLAALASGAPLPVIGLHLAVGVVALLMGMVVFALRWAGGGDAKLFAAAALWLGWPAVLTFGVWMALAGGAMAFALLTLRSAPARPLMMLGPPWMVRLTEPGAGVPYGVAIAAGAIAAFPASPLAASLPL